MTSQSSRVMNILFVLFAFINQISFGQPLPKAIKYYQKSQIEIQKNRPDVAIDLLQNALKISPDYKDAHLALYKIYLAKPNLDLALDHLIIASKVNDKDQPGLLFNAGKLSLQIGKYSQANESLSAYLNLNTKDTSTRSQAMHFLSNVLFAQSHIKDKVPFDPVILNKSINTSLPEYLPSIDAVGSTLVFTRRVNGQEDIFLAKGSDSSWSKVTPWSQNTNGNEGAHTISANGKTIVFTRCGAADGIGGCDLYISENINHAWTKPKNMGSEINTSYWESQPTLSANGRSIYFVSNRPGGIGGYDLWQCNKINDQWSKPKNLGKSINTPWDELSPWLHADGVHLYFRSNGWPGYGSFDLFVAMKQIAIAWNAPINLGYPINDYKDQGAMSVSLDGRSAFLTNQVIDINNALVSSDIVLFHLDPKASSNPCVFIQGNIRELPSGDVLKNAKIVFNSNSPAPRYDSTYSDQDGEYLIVLPRQNIYQLFCQVDGYNFYSDRVEIDSTAQNRIHYDIGLLKISKADSLYKDKPIVLKNVLFEIGSAILTQDSYIELDRMMDYLASHTDTKIEIRGHTDHVGAAAFNLNLSTLRAKAVYDYFNSKKIPLARMSYHGYGDTMPLLLENSEINRAVNRRVEIKLSII